MDLILEKLKIVFNSLKINFLVMKTLKFLSFFQDDFLNHSFTEIVNQNTQEDIFGNKTSLIFSLSDLKIFQ